MKTTPNNTPMDSVAGSFHIRNPYDTTERLLRTKVLNGSAFFNKNFQGDYTKTNRNNKGLNGLINLAMAGTYPLTSISYPNVLISRGVLPSAENVNATLNKDGNILFSWSDNSGTKTDKANDKVIIVTYFPATKEIVYTLLSATRGSCQASLHINKMRGYAADTWIGFVSHDERDAGDSVYAGRVIL